MPEKTIIKAPITIKKIYHREKKEQALMIKNSTHTANYCAFSFILGCVSKEKGNRICRILNLRQ